MSKQAMENSDVQKDNLISELKRSNELRSMVIKRLKRENEELKKLIQKTPETEIEKTSKILTQNISYEIKALKIERIENVYRFKTSYDALLVGDGPVYAMARFVAYKWAGKGATEHITASGDLFSGTYAASREWKANYAGAKSVLLSLGEADLQTERPVKLIKDAYDAAICDMKKNGVHEVCIMPTPYPKDVPEPEKKRHNEIRTYLRSLVVGRRDVKVTVFYAVDRFIEGRSLSNTFFIDQRTKRRYLHNLAVRDFLER